jgi:hypothetical protein
MAHLELVERGETGLVLQIKPTRDRRRSSHATVHFPEGDRSGTAGLESTVAESSELAAGRSNDKTAPVPGIVSYTARPRLARSGMITTIMSAKASRAERAPGLPSWEVLRGD